MGAVAGSPYCIKGKSMPAVFFIQALAECLGKDVGGFADGTNSHGKLLAMDAKKPGTRERAPGLRMG